MLKNFKRLAKITELGKEIINFSKEKISEMNKEEKLENLVERVESLNTQNQQFEALSGKIDSLDQKIKTLKEIESDFLQEIEMAAQFNTKEYIMLKIDLKTKLDKTYEELYKLIEEKELLEKEAAKIKAAYIKEHTNFEKLLKNKANEILLEKKYRKKGIYGDTRSFSERFEEAVNNFTFEMFSIKDSSSMPKISSGNVDIYEDGTVVEAKFVLDSGTFLVSVSSKIDSINIGKLNNDKSIELIGKGEGFDKINWLSNEYGNHFIVVFYEQLMAFKDEIESINEIYSGFEPTHLHLVG